MTALAKFKLHTSSMVPTVTFTAVAPQPSASVVEWSDVVDSIGEIVFPSPVRNAVGIVLTFDDASALSRVIQALTELEDKWLATLRLQQVADQHPTDHTL